MKTKGWSKTLMMDAGFSLNVKTLMIILLIMICITISPNLALLFLMIFIIIDHLLLPVIINFLVVYYSFSRWIIMYSGYNQLVYELLFQHDVYWIESLLPYNKFTLDPLVIFPVVPKILSFIKKNVSTVNQKWIFTFVWSNKMGFGLEWQSRILIFVKRGSVNKVESPNETKHTK